MLNSFTSCLELNDLVVNLRAQIIYMGYLAVVVLTWRADTVSRNSKSQEH